MKKMLALFGAAALVLAANTTAVAHDDEDGVTRIDRYRDANVVHYDHHHRQIYTDEFGNVIGEQAVHHDHDYVEPRYRHHRRHHRASWFFGGY